MAERKRDYPTGDPNGMSFICNRWVFTGPQGYRVIHYMVDTARYGWTVVRYDAAGSRPAGYSSEPMTETEAHEYAARLSGRPVNPEV